MIYPWTKKLIKWKINNTLYMSMPFTWLIKEAKQNALLHKGKVIIGGSGAKLMKDKIDWAEIQEDSVFDTLSMHNPLATFTTRGCIKNCKFCAVPKIEGEFRELTDWKMAPIVCDNNLLASSRKHFELVISSLTHLPVIDFSQGLDASLLKDWHLDQFRRLKKVKIRFSFDNIKEENIVLAAIEKCQKASLPDIGVYVLINFKDTPEDAKYRLELIRKVGAMQFPMRYQPLDCIRKNSFVEIGWTEAELRKIVLYYSRSIWYGHVDYDDFERYPYREQETLFTEIA